MTGLIGKIGLVLEIFLQVIYLVEMTKVQPYFIQVIARNSINLYQISAKVNWCLIESFTCVPSSSLIGMCISVLWPN